MAENKKKVVALLKDPDDEDKIRRYAITNGLEILYSFKGHGDFSGGAPMIKKVFMEFAAVTRGKRRFNKDIFIKAIKRLKESVRFFRRKSPFEDMSLMAAVEYLAQYEECQGLLVYDVRNIYPQDPSVSRWVIDKIHATGKEVYSVVPYAYGSLPQWEDKLESSFSRKRNELIETCDFHYRRCPPIVSICV
ncbi:hypothetical protein HY605_06190, partial [Candidatus Peregrinibacteria bacterium]|nr:hypothetical protein [Candidatus Peregrinibacteria bacterium]